jgi:trigger factor
MSESEASGLVVTTTETGPIERSLAVEVDAKRVRKAFDRAYRDLAKSVKVRGFRPGKVPRPVLEKLYGASMGEEIERLLVSETLAEAVAQSGVEPVAEPAIEAEVPQPGEPFSYTATLEVKPAIALPELTGLPGTKPPVLVEDSDVEGELQGMRESRAPLEDEPEDAVASAGSVLTLDYEGRVDGELFEGGQAEGATVELGTGRFIPGFEEQLEGVRAGEERELRVTFPEDYPAEDVAGKEAVFLARVHSMRRKQVPELCDAFAAELGIEGVETLEALRERLHKDLVERREKAADDELRKSVMDSLIEQTEFQVPPGLVDGRLSQRLEMAHQQLGSLLPEEELHARLREWQQEWRPDAERDVRETLLLEAVATKQAVEATDEEVEERLERMARDQGIALERLRQNAQERGALESLRARIREEKALEFLLAEARVEATTGT